MERLDESWWQLFSFEVDKRSRGKGYGTLLMEDVLQRSKAMNASVILQAQPYQGEPGLKQESLVLFYQKHGFVIIPQPMNSYWLMWDVKDH
jgi:GNAT superfamily N-acetyltransferase